MIDPAHNPSEPEAGVKPRSARPRRGIDLLAALLLVLGLAAGTSFGCTYAPAVPPSAGAPVESFGDCHRVESERFSMVSDPWINLHHFLFQWARNVPRRQPDDRRPAVEVPERHRLRDLDEGERASWARAVGVYRQRLAGRDIVHDRQLIALRQPLGTIACANGTPADLDPRLRAALLEAIPVYRRHWWPGHLAQNLEWTESLASALAPYEEVLSDRIAEAYGGRWPDERTRVDVTVYASWQGAYTTNRPNWITLTSHPDHRGVRAVDLLFHEVSHASFFEQPFLAHLSAAFRAQGVERPPGLLHVIQFVTPSELIRRELASEDLRGFVPYAELGDLYRRNTSWGELREVVEDHWVSFLAGEIERSEALSRIVAELVEPAPVSEQRGERPRLPAANHRSPLPAA